MTSFTETALPAHPMGLAVQAPALAGIKRDYTADDVRKLARLAPDPAHAGRARRRAAVGAAAHRALCQRARRAHRQPGDAEGEGRPEGDLSLRLAGGGRCQPAGQMYPDQSLYPANSVPDVVRKHQQHVAARRPDPDHAKASGDTTGSRRSSPTPRPASAARSTRSS